MNSILLIEDDEAISSLLKQILEFEDYKVTCAGNGKEALDLLRSGFTPKAIICDLMMPVMDGYQFRAEQLKDSTLNTIPTLIMTADSYTTTLKGDLKPFDFLAKPLLIEIVLEKVGRAVKQ